MLVIILGVLLTGISIVQTQSNQYEEGTGINGDDIWRSLSDFIPQQSQSFGTIKIGNIMFMEFDFTWHGYTHTPRGEPYNDYEMFFRVGCDANGDVTPGSPCIGGTGCSGAGVRYPSFWVTPPLTPGGYDNGPPRMHVSISSGNSGGCQPAMELTDWGELFMDVELHINMYWNETDVIVGVGHAAASTLPEWETRFDRISPTEASHIGIDMPVWFMGNKNREPYYNVGNGTFRNVIITSMGFPTTTTTESPTSI